MLTHTIAAVLLELAYLTVGVVLCFMGQRLLERGIEGRTRVEGNIAGGKWMLATSSPGIVFAVCGLGIIIYAIATPSIYEEKVSISAQTSQSSSSTTPQSESPQASAITSTQSSRLLQQPSAGTALLSRIAIYALQRKSRSLINQDIASDIQRMPTRPNDEPWPQTYQRFGQILQKNPSALLEVLNQPKYRWLLDKDHEDGSLSALVILESERLGSSTQTNSVKP